MRLLLLAFLGVASVGQSVTPFVWSIIGGQTATHTVAVPAGMTWIVEQVTGYEKDYAAVASVVGIAPGSTTNYQLFISPSSIAIDFFDLGIGGTLFYFADYGRQLTARFTGELSARSVNNTTIPDRLAISGYLTPNLAGDYSGDGIVNAADYTVLRDSAAAFEPSDMASWRSSYGHGAASSIATPEPSAAILAAVATLALASRHRTRRRFTNVDFIVA